MVVSGSGDKWSMGGPKNWMKSKVNLFFSQRSSSSCMECGERKKKVRQIGAIVIYKYIWEQIICIWRIILKIDDIGLI